MSEEYVTVNQVRIRYMVRGSGPAVLLIHGLGEFLEVWSFNIAALSEYFTVYAIDLPGHGLSEEARHDYTLAFGVKFVVDFMQATGIQHGSLIGHSLSGPLCLGLAMDFPDKVDKVILVGSSGFSEEIPLTYRLATLPLLGDILLGPTVLINKATVRVGMRKQFYNPEIVPEEWIDTAIKYLRMPKRKNTIRKIIKNSSSVTATNTKAIITDRLPLVETPTLIVHGMQDKVVPVDSAYFTCNLIPHAQLKVFDECGHNPQMEKASEFNKLVVAFLTLRCN